MGCDLAALYCGVAVPYYGDRLYVEYEETEDLSGVGIGERVEVIVGHWKGEGRAAISMLCGA